MGSYRALVEALSVDNVSLSCLSKFFSNDVILEQHCRIGAVRFDPGKTEPTFASIESESLASELEQMLEAEDAAYHGNESSSSTTSCTLGHILLVEDLTKEIIEVLGSKLDIDPTFFALHMTGPDCNIPDLRTLPSQRNSTQFVNISYHKVIKLTGSAKPIVKTTRLQRNTNVYRKVMVLPSWEDITIALVQHQCSIFMKTWPNRNWVGLILVDPQIEVSYAYDDQSNHTDSLWPHPIMDYSANSITTPNIRYRASNLGGTFRGLFDDLKHHYQGHSVLSTNVSSNQSFQIPNLFSLACHPLRIAAGEWINYKIVMHRLVKQHEYSNKENFRPFDNLSRLNSDLRLLQSWRRRTMASLDKLDSVVRFLNFYRALDGSSEKLEGLLEDYRHLARGVKTYGSRLENMLPVVTSLVQIDDSRRAFAETINISRLTILALIFVPLNFISSLFSMGGEFAPGQRRFWVYFSLAMPLTGLVILFACSPVRKFRRRVNKQ